MRFFRGAWGLVLVVIATGAYVASASDPLPTEEVVDDNVGATDAAGAAGNVDATTTDGAGGAAPPSPPLERVSWQEQTRARILDLSFADLLNNTALTLDEGSCATPLRAVVVTTARMPDYASMPTPPPPSGPPVRTLRVAAPSSGPRLHRLRRPVVFAWATCPPHLQRQWYTSVFN